MSSDVNSGDDHAFLYVYELWLYENRDGGWTLESRAEKGGLFR